MGDNNCATCEHKKHPDGGHCYMFREEPAFVCRQHQDRRGKEVRVGTIGHVGGRASIAIAVATILAQQSDSEQSGEAGGEQATPQTKVAK